MYVFSLIFIFILRKSWDSIFILRRHPTYKSCHELTHTPRYLPFTSKLIKQFLTVPLTPFACEHIAIPQAHLNRTLPTQVLLFLLFQYSAQFTHFLFRLLFRLGWTSHLRTASWFWALSPTTTIPFFRVFSFFALACLAPKHSSLRPRSSLVSRLQLILQSVAFSLQRFSLHPLLLSLLV